MRKSIVYTLIACLLASSLPFSVTADATDDIPTNAAGTGVHDSLVAALTQADLVTTLQGDGPFTVFAPTDQAFTDAGIDLTTFDTDEEIAALADILLYHVVSGTILSTDLADGANTVVAANGDKLNVTLDAGAVTVGASGATVTTADVVSSNGVIHVIDKVLMPPPGDICYNVISHTIIPGATNLICNSHMFVENYTMGGQTITGCYNTVTHAVSNISAAECGAYMWTPAVSIAMTAGATTIHTSLVAALTAADLVTTLSGDTEYTVFAPSDDAFAAAGIDLDSYDTPEEIAALADILLHHVVPGVIPSSALADGANTVVAANGDKLTVTVADGTVTVGADGAAVTLADVPASNGVIHVIDKVLMPPPGDICYNMVSHTIVPGATNLICNSYMYVVNYTMAGQTITGCYNTVTHAVSDISSAECGAYMWTPAVSIAMTAGATTIHTSLVAALTAADLVTTLSGDTEYTVFAPSDDAFAAAGIDLDSYDTPEEIAVLTDILLYHVVAGTTMSADLAEGMTTVTAANGDDLTINVANGGVMVGTAMANVTLADVPASNGVIHVIDQVLMPPADETPDPFEGVDCAVTIGLTADGYGFSPSITNIDVGQTVCWSWTDAAMGHNVKQVDGFQSTTFVANGVTSGAAATTVAFHHTFTENQTFYYACEPHISMNMFGEVVVGDGGAEPASDNDDDENTPGFMASTMILAGLGAILFMGRRRSL